jgi:hypothetical protein
MDNQDVFDAVLGVDDDFLPDGWDGKTDILTEDGQLNDAAFVSDGEQDEELLVEENEESGEEAEEAPTTGEDEPAETPDQDAEDVTEEAPADEPEEPPAKPSRKLKLKVNHKEEELDLDSMSDEDLTALLQKGRAYDLIKEAENKKKFRDVYQEQLDAGMTDAVARVVAQAATDGKAYSLEDEADDAEEADKPAEDAAPSRNFINEVAQLQALFPEVKEIPDEVAKAAALGAPLLSAYLAYREKQSSKTVASLKKENEILKQNAAASARAPVKGVTGGGNSTPAKKDPFLEGWDDVDNW